MDGELLDDILFRYKHPRHHGQLASAPLTDSNPSCGDSIELYLDIQQGIVRQAAFTGQMCAIANYGAELLCDQLANQPVAQVKAITSQQLLPTSCSLLTNPTRLRCFETAQRALAKLTGQSLN